MEAMSVLDDKAILIIFMEEEEGSILVWLVCYETLVCVFIGGD